MRARSMFLLCLAPFALALVQGCGDDTAEDEGLGSCPDSSDTLQAQGSQALKDNCLGCHSSTVTNRNGAPADKNMDDLNFVRQNADEIYAEVSEGAMPPSGKLAADDIEAIRAYLACGAQ